MALASLSQIDEFTILQFFQFGICGKECIVSFKQLISDIPRAVGHLLLSLPMLWGFGFIDFCDLDEPTNLPIHFDLQRWDLEFGF